MMTRKLFLMMALAMSVQHCMATSYNLDQFTILIDTLMPTSINVDSGFVVYADMNGGLGAYDLATRQEFTITQIDVDSMTVDMKGGFVTWRTMTDASLYGYDLLRQEQFTIAEGNVDGMAIGMSEKYVVWRDSVSGFMEAFNLSTREVFTASMMPVESMKPLIAGNFSACWPLGLGEIHGSDLDSRQIFVITTNEVNSMSLSISPSYLVWTNMGDSDIQVFDFPARRSYAITGSGVSSMGLDVKGHFVKWLNMTTQALHGYDLQDEEGFVIASGSVDAMTVTMDDRHVVWINPTTANPTVYGYDLVDRKSFQIGPAPSSPQPLSLSQDYLVWRFYDTDVMLERVFGYDLFARERFEIASSTSGASMFHPIVSDQYVIWQDYIDMTSVLLGGQIFEVANDVCDDAIEVFPGVPYLGDSTGASGTVVSGCGFNDVLDVWHLFRPGSGGDYTVSLSGSSFDTTVSLYNSCNGQELACNDDADLDNIHSSIAATMVKGKSYLIRVAGFDGQTGQYQLNVNAGKCTEPIISDLDKDCKVNMADLAIMAAQWMTCKHSIPTLCLQ